MLRLRRSTGAGSGFEPGEVIACLQGTAVAEDRLGHAFARASAAGVNVVLFIATARLAAAERIAAGLYERVRYGQLSGYELTSCQVELNLPIAEALVRLTAQPESPDRGEPDPDTGKA